MTRIMKWLSITMLLLAVLQLPVASHPVLLAIVVCASGLLVAAQAIRAGKPIVVRAHLVNSTLR